jgi:hypothetical protein
MTLGYVEIEFVYAESIERLRCYGEFINFESRANAFKYVLIVFSLQLQNL